MNRARTYSKYVVQRSVGGQNVEKSNDGSPVLGKCVKTNIRITPEMAETLNHGWDSVDRPLSFFYVEDKSTSKDERKELFAEAKDLGLDVAKNIKTEDLKTRLANHKAE